MGMRSELHDRLDYLVNYSSQLIFVSGDSIAQQQQNLEAFIYQQHDDTEIAYLTATPDMDIADYRRQLCRQLLGQVVGSFVRPLNELLVPLNHHEGPVMIAIIQAHHIPDTLLQELWDLVLQSRFAGNKQHLNVLLFGNTEWAENAKKWLPAKNTDTPLLISNQQVTDTPPSGTESQLDKMLAQHREAFQAHLDKRNASVVSVDSPKNPLKSKRLYIGIGFIFLITFCGIVSWQYKDDLSSIFAPIEPIAQSTTEDIIAGSAFKKMTETMDDTSSIEVTSNTDTAQVVQDKSQAPINDARLDSKPLTPQEQSLVTIGTKKNTALQSAEKTEDTVEDLSEDKSTTPTLLEEVKGLENAPIDTNVSINEHALADIGEWVLPNQFVIQLVGMKDKAMIDQFIEQNQLSHIVRQYKTQRYGGAWHVVVYHQTFDSIDEARSAISTLPDFPTKGDAFVKKGQQVLDEIKRVSND